MLSVEGYEVRTCEDGDAAIAAYDSGAPDVILLDVQMPGKSGLETFRELRERPGGFDVPVVMVSGVDVQGTIMEFLGEGADDYILKPFNAAELLAKIAVVLTKYAGRRDPDVGFQPGARFADRFRIEKRIGTGGFGRVYLARDMSEGADVALKVFQSPGRKSATARVMSNVLREAYEMSKLDFPTIVKFLGFGQSGTFYYLVMEYVKGNSLKEFVTNNGVLEEPDLSVVGYEIARALRHFQERQMVHGDIKPGNVMLSDDGEVKLLDFGLTRTLSDAAVMGADEIITTPAYSAPESMELDGVVDVASDVYCLGGSLYFGATGAPPYPGDTCDEVLRLRHGHQPTPVDELNPNISPGFAELINGMLSEAKGDRPSVEDVIAHLTAFLPTELG